MYGQFEEKKNIIHHSAFIDQKRRLIIEFEMNPRFKTAQCANNVDEFQVAVLELLVAAFVALPLVMLIMKQLRHTRTALLRPNFGSGACELEHTPQKTPPQLRQ